MLEELHVQNLGIIRSARIEPGAGLVAVTGETGAGKTLLLGALRLLRGDTARTDRVGPHGSEATAEGRFSLGATETVVARRVAVGKSRAYLDGAMVPAKALSERLEALVEIVSQHEHVALRREASVRRLVDGLLDSQGRDAAATYASAFTRLGDLRAEREEIGGDVEALQRELELLEHQASEIEAAALDPEEEETLKLRLVRMRNAGGISTALADTTRAIEDDDGGTDSLRTAAAALEAAVRLDPSLAPLRDRLTNAIADLDDIAGELRSAAAAVEHDPGTLAALEERTSVIADLKRKYAPTLEGVVAAGAEAAEAARVLRRRAQRAASIDDDIAGAEAAAAAAGEMLAEARRRAGKQLAESALEHLRQLGFRDPALRIEVTAAAPAAAGADRITLLFASDSDLPLGPVSRVASGGELSRLVLAVRVAAGVAEADVVAFDEVDAGVGGAAALAMGELLSRLAATRQVFVVTHLPQVAAFADTHFVVERTAKEAVVRLADGDERIAEISRMLSGMGESESGRDHAADLLALAAQRRRA